jgi:hypothetical protein
VAGRGRATWGGGADEAACVRGRLREDCVIDGSFRAAGIEKMISR